MKYERLTERKENGAVQYEDRNGYYHTFYSGNDGDPVHALAWKLAELEDKIEQGTLIEFNMKLPFKVGGTAYWLNGLPNCIQEYKVLGYIFDYSAGVRVDFGDFQPILFRAFGEKLFACREEAEKRLKEL